MLYNIPSRKVGALQGVSAMCPADMKFDQEPGGQVLRKFAAARPGADAKADDRIWGKTVAFDKDRSVAYANSRGAETWENKGKLNIYAKKFPARPISG